MTEMSSWKKRLSAGAMGAFFVSVLGIWFLTSALDYQWFARPDVGAWYSWPAAVVSQSLQEAGAERICSISLGDVCAPVAAPARHADLSCWAGSGATWCADPTFATATLVWCLLGLVAYVVSRLLWPTLGAPPPELGQRGRRNYALFQLGLEAVMIVWMGWTVYDIIHNPGGASDGGDCTAGACVFDVANGLPEALFYVVMVLFGLVTMIDTGVRHRRDLMVRAAPILEAGK